jgi:hypothetical protein
VAGALLHADETTINLKKIKSYVWVFTNMEEVVFVFRPDRNASLLARSAEGFSRRVGYGLLHGLRFAGMPPAEVPRALDPGLE